MVENLGPTALVVEKGGVLAHEHFQARSALLLTLGGEDLLKLAAHVGHVKLRFQLLKGVLLAAHVDLGKASQDAVDLILDILAAAQLALEAQLVEFPQGVGVLPVPDELDELVEGLPLLRGDGVGLGAQGDVGIALHVHGYREVHFLEHGDDDVDIPVGAGVHAQAEGHLLLEVGVQLDLQLVYGGCGTGAHLLAHGESGAHLHAHAVAIFIAVVHMDPRRDAGSVEGVLGPPSPQASPGGHGRGGQGADLGAAQAHIHELGLDGGGLEGRRGHHGHRLVGEIALGQVGGQGVLQGGGVQVVHTDGGADEEPAGEVLDVVLVDDLIGYGGAGEAGHLGVDGGAICVEGSEVLCVEHQQVAGLECRGLRQTQGRPGGVVVAVGVHGARGPFAARGQGLHPIGDGVGQENHLVQVLLPQGLEVVEGGGGIAALDAA